MSYGLTTTGFRRKPRTVIMTEMEAAARTAFGENVNLTERSPLGMFLGVLASSVDDIWILAESLYYSGYVDTAIGESLDSIGAYIGIVRREAVAATGEITVSGTDGTIVPIGFRVATEDGVEFYVSEYDTISGGDVTVPITAVIKGTSGNVGASLVTEIPTPYAGIDSVTNAAAIEGGLRRETDAEFRARYKRSVSKPGSSTAASIEATLLELDGVTEALVRQNTTMVEVDSIPAKSIAPLVYGGDDDEIGAAIFGVKSAGIQSAAVGADPGLEIEITVQDSLGEDHVIGFARPEEVDIYVDCELDTDSSFPVDGIARVTTAIAAYVNGLSIGDDVIYTRMIARIQSIPGIVDINELFVGIAPDPVGTVNISIDADQIARADEGDIGVTEAP